MAKITPPPIQHPMVDSNGNVTTQWAEYFDAQYRGDRGTEWTPTFTSLTTSGSPTITGRYYRISERFAYFWVRIVPGTNTSATAGTTYIGNFPLRFTQDSACWAVTGLLGSNAGMIDSATNRIYVPAWSAVTVPLTIVGIAEVR